MEQSWVEVTKKPKGEKEKGNKSKDYQGNVTKTGYEKIGESRLFLPLSRWGAQFWRRICNMAVGECRVYKGMLKPFPIEEINLLEIQSEISREGVSFSTDPGGAKYILSVVGFKIRGNELVANFVLDNAFAIHTSVYLFKNKIKMEYSSIPVGEFQIPIRPPEAAINYLQSLTNRRYTMTYSLTELVLEEMGQFKSLWMGNAKGIWIDVKSIPLIQRLQNSSEATDDNVVRTAQQIESVEEEIMMAKPDVIKSSELDEGLSKDEILEMKREEKEEKPQVNNDNSQILTSTRIDGPGGNSISQEEEIKMKGELLNALHKKKAPIFIPFDEEIVDMLDKIKAVNDKFEKTDKTDPKVLADIVVTVEALVSVLKEKGEITDALEAEEGHEEDGTKRGPARSVDELALGLSRKKLAGAKITQQRAEDKQSRNKEDWLKSGLQDDLGRLWGPGREQDAEQKGGWGSSQQW